MNNFGHLVPFQKTLLSEPYLESVVILALVIVKPAQIIISRISPSLSAESGFNRANVLGGKKPTKIARKEGIRD